VEIAVNTATVVVLVSKSDSGTFYCIKDDSAAGTFYKSGNAENLVNTAALCNGTTW
jgi:hypothetical protein